MIAQVARFFGLVLVSLLSLQLYFAMRIAAMLLFDPQSTTFQRSEAWRLWTGPGLAGWSQSWVAGSEISDQLKRAVIASEDAGFVDQSLHVPIIPCVRDHSHPVTLGAQVLQHGQGI